MTTQLAIDLKPTAPLQARPIAAPLYICPVRDKCLIPCRGKERITQRPRSVADVPCGFEQAGSVMACHKREGLEP